jgi:flagellar biosynthesis protein FlhG
LEQLDPERPGWRSLRRWFRRAAAVASSGGEGVVVAVASGKGGTGKSFVATNAAIALQELGLRVALVDCDFGLANAHLLFGVSPQYSLQHVLEGSASIRQAMMRTPFGPTLVAGGSGVTGLAAMDAHQMRFLGKVLQQTAACHDIVLLDCAAGLAPQTLLLASVAPCVVMVTNPEIAALTDAYAMIKCLARQSGGPSVNLAVNRVVQAGLGKVTFDRLADVSRRFSGCQIHYLGEVPEDPAVAHRRLGQPPLLRATPPCPTTRALLDLSLNLKRHVLGLPRPALGIEARVQAQLRKW